jgi:hypothetical protein
MGLKRLGFMLGICMLALLMYSWLMGALSAHGQTVVVPPGPIVEAGTPVPIATASVVVSSTATVTPVVIYVVQPDIPSETPVAVCGSAEMPCSTKLVLPVIDEQGGGGMLGLLVLFGLIMPFIGASDRVVVMLAIVASVTLCVVTGMLGYLFAPPFLLICIVPLRQILGFLGASR